MLESFHGLPWKDIIKWDVENWSDGPVFWFTKTHLELHKCKALEIGAKEGGISLLLAKAGMEVICSDLKMPSQKAMTLHSSYGVQEKVTYASINALDIGFPEASFDLVVFKSVLGALKSIENQQKMFSEIYRILKPSGEVWFADNLTASLLHMTARKLFIKWGKSWRYISPKEIKQFCKSFKEVKLTYGGFLGVFGRSELQRQVLGKIDKKLAFIIPTRWKYIVFGIARK